MASPSPEVTGPARAISGRPRAPECAVAEGIEEPVERVPDVADDVAPERVAVVVAPRDAGEVEPGPERDERPNLGQVLGPDLAERVVAVVDDEPVARVVERELGPRCDVLADHRHRARWCSEVPVSFEGTANDEARLDTEKAVASSALRISVSGRIRVRSVAKASHRSASRTTRRAWTSAVESRMPETV